MCQRLVLDFLIIETFQNQEKRKNTKDVYWRSVGKKSIYLTVVVPEGRDNDVGHAIIVVDNLVLIPPKNMH